MFVMVLVITLGKFIVAISSKGNHSANNIYLFNYHLIMMAIIS